MIRIASVSTAWLVGLFFSEVDYRFGLFQKRKKLSQIVGSAGASMSVEFYLGGMVCHTIHSH